ncbi:MAG TPA: hypothetical protein VGO67_05630 [Verrucomicrobiae bacterium]|jgi:hypothetical protein
MDAKLQLQRQLNFIITSCREYDAGRREEAIRIAVPARVLFHDTHNSQSLVKTHLKMQGIQMRSTCSGMNAANPALLSFIGLEPGTASFRPRFDDVLRDEQVSLDIWWQGEPIMQLFRGKETITRRQLILAAVNKDGGAHVDPIRPTEYERMDAGLGIELDCIIAGQKRRVPVRFAQFAALRQIGHEVLTSSQLIALAQ